MILSSQVFDFSGASLCLYARTRNTWNFASGLRSKLSMRFRSALTCWRTVACSCGGRVRNSSAQSVS